MSSSARDLLSSHFSVNIFYHSYEVENPQPGRLQEGRGYPKNNQQHVAQTTLTEDLKLVQFVLKNSWHSLIASPGTNSQRALYFDLK